MDGIPAPGLDPIVPLLAVLFSTFTGPFLNDDRTDFEFDTCPLVAWVVPGYFCLL